MAVGDIYHVQFVMNNNDRLVSTDVHYEETSPRLGTIAEVTGQLVVQAQTDFWTTFWKPFASAKATYQQTRAQMISPTREAPIFSTSLIGDPGTQVADPMNGQTALLVAQYGTTWSREFSGRAFLPGLAEDQADIGRVTAGAWAFIQLGAGIFYIASTVLPGPAGGTFTMGVLSPKRLKAATPPFISPTVNVVVRARISRQVRRKTLAISLS